MKNYIYYSSLIIFLFGINIFSQQTKNNQKLFDVNGVDFERMKEVTTQEFSRLNQLKLQMTDSQKKLSTDLMQLINNEFLPSANSIESHSNTMLKFKQFKPFEFANDIQTQVWEGQVYVYIYLNEGSFTSIADQFAENVTNRDEKNNMAVAWVKVKNLEALASLTGVRKIRTVFPPVTRSGSVITEGDAIHNTEIVRNAYGLDGTGINIGVISDGVDSRSSAQLSGDLPPDGLGLTVVSNTQGGDEGTALLEIIYDMVPGANLFFHDYGTDITEFNAAIDNLVDEECDIICDDVGFLFEPFFEDGTIASHISSVITSNDIIYVSACGNSGGSHHQADFYPLSSFVVNHDFSLGTSPDDNYMYANIPANQDLIVIFQWNEFFGASGENYNLGLFSFDDEAYVQVSIDVQDGDDDPLEYLFYTPTTSGDTDDYAIVIQKADESVEDKIVELYIYPYGTASNYSNNNIPDDGIFGHPAVEEVVSVGAIDQATPGTIEYFSSWGPSTIEFPTTEIRQTPKIVGVDGNVISGAGGFGYWDGTNYRFYGTSASAPHIVAVLAQAWSYDLMQTGDDVRQLLYDWPVDLGAAGYDNIFGYGRGDALNIFDNALPVELSSFTAKVLRTGGVKLDWRTETEVDNYGFEIERSQVNPKSEIRSPQFEKIGFAEGYGNSNSPKNYSFIDTEAKYGNYSYRLKQIDTDGDFEYSKIIEIDAGLIPNGFVLEQNFPNPFNPNTTIKFALFEEENATLKIYDILGNEVVTLFDDKTEAGRVYELDFDASLLPSGNYFYKLQTTEKVEVKKMLLLK